jgi:hypothetical protein
MPQITHNPDRNFSADRTDELNADALRLLLKRSDVPDMFDRAVQERIGKVIAQAILNSAQEGTCGYRS